MDENRNNQPGGDNTPQQTTARPQDAAPGGAPKPVGRIEKMKERTARIRKQANDDFEEKPLSRRQRRKRAMQDEAVEYYYDDDAAARRAGIGCLIALLIALAIIGGILLSGWNWYKAETGGDHATVNGSVQVTISGTGASAVGTVLEDNGLISNGMLFRLYSRYLSDDNPTFRSGTFELQGGMGYDEIIEVLAAGEAEPELVWVQVRDGHTIMSVANTFGESDLNITSEEFLNTANDLGRFKDITFIEKYLEDFDSNVFHPAEGLVLPETYSFTENMTAEEIVRQLYEFTDSKFTEDMYARIDELGFSVREYISFASMVQAESGFAAEDAKVAGVFLNRLNDPATFTNLDSDVTLRYIKQWMQWNMEEYSTMTFREITWQVAMEAVGETKFLAYNTVGQGGQLPAKEGLPNGAIGAITEATLTACLYPDTADGYCFFVTDAYNNYYYAVTNAEHEVNVAEAERMDAKFEEEGGEDHTEDGNDMLDDLDTDVYGVDETGDGDEGEGE